MAWQRNYVTLSTGERVRYAFVDRPGSGVYFVRFRGPAGNRLERSTGAARKPDAVRAAHRLILEEYRQIAPSSDAEGRFPGWEMPKLFFTVKALSACRLDDLCQLRSAQLQDGRLVFPADLTKNRSERYAPLPPDVYDGLRAYAGETYLWEKYPAELIAVNKKKGFPTHRQNPAFAPRRLYLWVVQIMQDYQKQTGNDLSSHDFRKAAFTRAAERDIHPKRAAAAFDVTAETMLRYYTATEKKKTADEVLGGLADDLRPKVPSKE